MQVSIATVVAAEQAAAYATRRPADRSAPQAVATAAADVFLDALVHLSPQTSHSGRPVALDCLRDAAWLQAALRYVAAALPPESVVAGGEPAAAEGPSSTRRLLEAGQADSQAEGPSAPVQDSGVDAAVAEAMALVTRALVATYTGKGAEDAADVLRTWAGIAHVAEVDFATAAAHLSDGDMDEASFR